MARVITDGENIFEIPEVEDIDDIPEEILELSKEDKNSEEKEQKEIFDMVKERKNNNQTISLDEVKEKLKLEKIKEIEEVISEEEEFLFLEEMKKNSTIIENNAKETFNMLNEIIEKIEKEEPKRILAVLKHVHWFVKNKLETRFTLKELNSDVKELNEDDPLYKDVIERKNEYRKKLESTFEADDKIGEILNKLVVDKKGCNLFIKHQDKISSCSSKIRIIAELREKGYKVNYL